MRWIEEFRNLLTSFFRLPLLLCPEILNLFSFHRSKRGAAMNIPAYEWSDDYRGGDDGDDEGDSAPRRTNSSFDSSGSDHVFHDDVGTNGTQLRTTCETSSLDATPHGRHGELNGKNGMAETSFESKTEEYTFEKAIRSYAEFAESRTKSSFTKKTATAATPLPSKDFFGADLESTTTSEKSTDRVVKDDVDQKDDTKEMVLVSLFC